MRLKFYLFAVVSVFLLASCKGKKPSSSKSGVKNENVTLGVMQPRTQIQNPAEAVISELGLLDNSTDQIHSYEIIPELTDDSPEQNLFCYTACLQGAACQAMECTSNYSLVLENLLPGPNKVTVKACFYPEMVVDHDAKQEDKTRDGRTIYCGDLKQATINAVANPNPQITDLMKQLYEVNDQVTQKSSEIYDLIAKSDNPSDVSLVGLLKENLLAMGPATLGELFKQEFLANLDAARAALAAQNSSSPGTTGAALQLGLVNKEEGAGIGAAVGGTLGLLVAYLMFRTDLGKTFIKWGNKRASLTLGAIAVPRNKVSVERITKVIEKSTAKAIKEFISRAIAPREIAPTVQDPVKESFKDAFPDKMSTLIKNPQLAPPEVKLLVDGVVESAKAVVVNPPVRDAYAFLDLTPERVAELSSNPANRARVVDDALKPRQRMVFEITADVKNSAEVRSGSDVTMQNLKAASEILTDPKMTELYNDPANKIKGPLEFLNTEINGEKYTTTLEKYITTKNADLAALIEKSAVDLSIVDKSVTDARKFAETHLFKDATFNERAAAVAEAEVRQLKAIESAINPQTADAATEIKNKIVTAEANLQAADEKVAAEPAKEIRSQEIPKAFALVDTLVATTEASAKSSASITSNGAENRTMYEVLGVDKNADRKTIAKAWKAKAREFQNIPERAAEFSKVIVARNILTDPWLKEVYDSNSNKYQSVDKYTTPVTLKGMSSIVEPKPYSEWLKNMYEKRQLVEIAVTSEAPLGVEERANLELEERRAAAEHAFVAEKLPNAAATPKNLAAWELARQTAIVETILTQAARVPANPVNKIAAERYQILANEALDAQKAAKEAVLAAETVEAQEKVKATEKLSLKERFKAKIGLKTVEKAAPTRNSMSLKEVGKFVAPIVVMAAIGAAIGGSVTALAGDQKNEITDAFELLEKYVRKRDDILLEIDKIILAVQ